jgi:hypothetical protein
MYHSVYDLQWRDFRTTVRENRPNGTKLNGWGGGGALTEKMTHDNLTAYFLSFGKSSLSHILHTTLRTYMCL